ncbi:quinol:cytochrome c oxidoreductase quinone-binding subunit 2 [Kordia periserrulae]|uniref:Quinol:cytochrome c oxidoreductase quinone-binding subunit 2 n=1 Tax=Kordia periserrulae TaxID=701523 RepID=A0A2T6C6D0_9FLAO|nr:quinol:cytochrome C oxidoreductase [Kordia periserrulae]PTX63853.1 quinol:cytochrome c oxidoreductase quinone-binding subunit 2 [Kordia periserrulae]
MYTFSNRLRLFAIASFVVGAIMVALSFMNTPGTVEEMKAMHAAHDAHGHGASHGTETHDADKTANHSDHKAETHGGESHDNAHSETAHHATDGGHHKSQADIDKHHLDQLQNKPWAAVYVAAFFFMMIALGVLAFYAIQRAAQAGWSPLLFRVMEGIGAYIIPGTIIIIALIVLSFPSLHLNHLFHWMDPDLIDKTNELKYDKLTDGKSGWLNTTAFLVRAIIYSTIWIVYSILSRRFSVKQDNSNDNSNFKKNFRLAAVFLVLFLISESMMSWDWIMSFDHHWFSTLFGWYVFASMFVSGITVIALITIYLKSRGYLEYVNDSHLHDLAKFMFGISIFWTYLWFSQFMLIWYSNIPEEVTYFITRIDDYTLPFFGMLGLNLIFPLLILMNSDFKRLNWIIVIAGIVILFGHYLDVFNMVMPATVGAQWSLGLAEVGAILLFLGLFIFVVFTTLTKAPLMAKRNPFIEESKHFHY